jgi:hypothetical protein
MYVRDWQAGGEWGRFTVEKMELQFIPLEAIGLRELEWATRSGHPHDW